MGLIFRCWRRYSDDAGNLRQVRLVALDACQDMQEWVNEGGQCWKRTNLGSFLFSFRSLYRQVGRACSGFLPLISRQKEEIQAYMEHGGVCSSSVRKDVLALYRSGALAGNIDWALRLQEVHDGLLVSYLAEVSRTEYACSSRLGTLFPSLMNQFNSQDLPRYKASCYSLQE